MDTKFIYSENYERYVYTRLEKFFDMYQWRYHKVPPCFLCIGHPEVEGDALGPKIGTNLNMLGYSVTGTILQPLNRKQCIRLADIYEKYSWVQTLPKLAIDASLGTVGKFGTIGWSVEKGITPASGVDETLNLKPLGDISIFVCVGRTLDDMVKASPRDITHIANIITTGIHRNIVERKLGIWD